MSDDDMDEPKQFALRAQTAKAEIDRMNAGNHVPAMHRWAAIYAEDMEYMIERLEAAEKRLLDLRE